MPTYASLAAEAKPIERPNDHRGRGDGRACAGLARGPAAEGAETRGRDWAASVECARRSVPTGIGRVFTQSPFRRQPEEMQLDTIEHHVATRLVRRYRRIRERNAEIS